MSSDNPFAPSKELQQPKKTSDFAFGCYLGFMLGMGLGLILLTIVLDCLMRIP
jgi:hypothetical protein